MKESTLKDILNSYEKRRDKAQSDLEQRILDVYAQIPRVKEIDNEISKIGLKLAKLVLSNPNDKDTILNECKNKINILTNEKKSLLIENNVPDWYINLEYKCKTCKDKGFLSNGNKCNCLKQEIISSTYKMSNLSRILDKENFDNFDLSLFSTEKGENNISPFENMELNILPTCYEFIKNFAQDNGENLLFYGDTGRRKNLHV